MQKESTVWMVHARTGMSGVKGALTLEGSELVFHPENAGRGETRIAVERIRRTRRVRGTPILEVYPRGTTLPDVVGFYFVEPPRIGDDATNSDTALTALNPFRRHTGRRTALRRLRLANATKKSEVQAWVDELRSPNRSG